MNRKECAALVALAWRQWPHIKPDQHDAELWFEHLESFTFEQARSALIKVLGDSEWPPKISTMLAELEPNHLDWVMNSVDFRRQFDRSRFPDQRCFDAAMASRQTFRTGTPEQCRKAYLAAWKALPREVDRRQLEVAKTQQLLDAEWQRA